MGFERLSELTHLQQSGEKSPRQGLAEVQWRASSEAWRRRGGGCSRSREQSQSDLRQSHLLPPRPCSTSHSLTYVCLRCSEPPATFPSLCTTRERRPCSTRHEGFRSAKLLLHLFPPETPRIRERHPPSSPATSPRLLQGGARA